MFLEILGKEIPLSPFVFSLVEDVLGHMVGRAMKIGIAAGFLIGMDCIYVPHLQFSND